MRIPVHRAVLFAGAAALVGLGIGLSVPAVASGPSASSSGDSGASAATFPHMNHVFVFMMENSSYSDLLNSANSNTTFIQSIANEYGLETNYYGVTHTSLPNYVAISSGSNWGSNTDDEAQADDGYFNHLSLFDELNQAGLSWRSYQESIPSVGYAGDYGDCTSSAGPDPTCTGLTSSGGSDTGTALYVRKHNPSMQYPDIFGNPQQADNNVPLTQLSADLASGHVAQFNWITPNICDDMHGGAPACPYPNTAGDANQQALYQDGDTFLQTWVTAIMHSKAWTGNSAIFVTWDESDYAASAPYGPEDDSACSASPSGIGNTCDSPVLPASSVDPASGGGGDLVGGTLYGGGHVPMIVIARNGPRHVSDSTPTNHYSFLQTMERNWGLPFIGNASDTIQVQSLAPLLGSQGQNSQGNQG